MGIKFKKPLVFCICIWRRFNSFVFYGYEKTVVKNPLLASCALYKRKTLITDEKPL